MMRKTFCYATVALLACSTMALAQSASGRVKRVDAGAGKITVDHGPIKSLNMDAMTMVFRVKDPAMLKQVKAGDRINFDAGRINGALTILKMKKR
jgi:Cu(I)/Ag(I) efflux system protein CusF